MNPTLQKLRALAQESVLSAQDSELKERHVDLSCAQLAAPLIRAFKDVENEYVRISILRQIWPDDYDRRDDRVSGLLMSMPGPEQAPYGLKIAMPHGFLSFEASLCKDGSPVFTCIRETDGQRPISMDFPDGERWLEYFYKIVADVVEL